MAQGDAITEAAARDEAIDWQHRASERSLSYGEISDAQAYFEGLAERFPALVAELRENGII